MMKWFRRVSLLMAVFVTLATSWYSISNGITFRIDNGFISIGVQPYKVSAVSSSANFSPEAHPETYSWDGYGNYANVYFSSCSGTEAAQVVNGSGVYGIVGIYRFDYGGDEYNLYRGLLSFNTSSLPDGCLVTGGRILLYGYSASELSSDSVSSNFCIASTVGSFVNDDGPSFNDFGVIRSFNVSSNISSGDWLTSTIPNVFEFNSDAFSVVSLTGTSDFLFADSTYDTCNLSTNFSVGTGSRKAFHTAEAGSEIPVLQVDYTESFETSQVSPDASPGSTTFDGDYYAGSVSILACRSLTTSTVTYNISTVESSCLVSESSASIKRGVVLFDLSSISGESEIVSATLSLWGTSSSGLYDPTFGITGAITSSNTSATGTDWDELSSFSYSDKFCWGPIAKSDWLTSTTANNFSLNSFAIDYLNGCIGSIAKLSLRPVVDDVYAEGGDIGGSVSFHSAEAGSEIPTLTLTYSTEGTVSSYNSSVSSGYWSNPSNANSSDNTYAFRNPGTTSSFNPTASTNGTNPWAYGSNGNTSNNIYANASPSYGSTTSKNPTANTNGTWPWTNGSGAYVSDGGYASASPSYNSSVKRPTGDDSNTVSGAPTPASPSTLYDKVDEASINNSDYYSMVTNGGGNVTFTYGGFSIPTGSAISNVSITYNGWNSGTASFYACLKIGTIYLRGPTSRDPGASPGTTYTDVYATNPLTGSNWSVSDLNLSGGNSSAYLNAFGTTSADCNPDNYISWIYITAYYYDSVKDQQYGTFGFTDLGGSITKVEIGYEAYATATQKFNLYTSASGGASWSSAHLTGDLPTSDPGSYTYVEVTSDQTWTWTLLNNTNFKVRVDTSYGSGTPSSITWYLDALIVRVTYNGTTTYDQKYGNFGISESNTLGTVEVGIEAYATVASNNISIYTSNDGGSSWSAAHNLTLGTSDPNAYTYVSCTSDFSWTWATLNNTNFSVKVVTSWKTGTPEWKLDALVARITSYESTNWTHTFSNFGISLTGSNITKVEVGYEAYANSSEKLGIEVTWNGGSSWSTAQNTSALPASDPGSQTYFDFTSSTTWDWYDLLNGNLSVRVTWTPSSTPSWGGILLDWLPVRVTYEEAEADISAYPTSKAFGVVNASSTYYAFGSAPSNPITDGQCYFYVANNGSGTVNLDWHIDDFTGGVGWNIVSGAPGSNEVRITGYYSGQNPAVGDILTNTDQDMYDGLAAGDHLHWDFKFETGTFTDGIPKSSTLTITGAA